MDRYRFIHRLKLGVLEIDTQHEEMEHKLLALSRALSDGDVVTPALRLDELIAFTEGHFLDEEQFLARADYSGLPEHRRQHAYLAGQLRDLKVQLASSRESLGEKLVDSLWIWFGLHVMKADRLAADYVHAKLSDKAPQPV